MADDGESKPTIVALCATALREHFDQHPFHELPALETFAPPEGGLLAPFLRPDAAIPQNPNSRRTPCLLLRDLENERHKDKPVYAHIDSTRSVGPTALYGTSGAGKTRSVYEYLSHNHGLFFVAADHQRNAGSEDLTYLLASLEIHCGIVNIGDTGGSDRNLLTVELRVLVMVYVRYAVLNWINETLRSNSRPGLTPLLWPPLQLYPKKYLGEDVFKGITRRCTDNADLSPDKWPKYADFKNLMKGVKSLGVPFIDEAQVLLTSLTNRFLSGRGDLKRSAFTALLKSFSSISKTHDLGTLYFLARACRLMP